MNTVDGYRTLFCECSTAHKYKGLRHVLLCHKNSWNKDFIEKWTCDSRIVLLRRHISIECHEVRSLYDTFICKKSVWLFYLIVRSLYDTFTCKKSFMTLLLLKRWYINWNYFL